MSTSQKPDEKTGKTDQKTDPNTGKKSTIKKAKGFKKTKPGTYLTIGTSLLSAFTNVKKARSARDESDTLKLLDAVAKTAAVVTGIALLVRELRRMNDDDVLTD